MTPTHRVSAPGAQWYPVHSLLAAYPIACFTGAFLTDIAYAETYNMQWANFSIWLITAGLVMGVIAAIVGIVDVVANKRVRSHRPGWFHSVGNALVLLISLWNAFVHSRDAYLRAHLKRLPDFDDIEAEERALNFVSNFASFHQALAFLIDWPALDRAAGLIMARTDELNGDQYGLLTPAADAIEQRHPLAATLALRAMIDLSLDAGKFKRYGHGARHLNTCEHLARRIDNFAGHADHAEYVATLRQSHARKSGFWDALG